MQPITSLMNLRVRISWKVALAALVLLALLICSLVAASSAEAAPACPSPKSTGVEDVYTVPLTATVQLVEGQSIALVDMGVKPITRTLQVASQAAFVLEDRCGGRTAAAVGASGQVEANLTIPPTALGVRTWVVSGTAQLKFTGVPTNTNETLMIAIGRTANSKPLAGLQHVGVIAPVVLGDSPVVVLNPDTNKPWAFTEGDVRVDLTKGFTGTLTSKTTFFLAEDSYGMLGAKKIGSAYVLTTTDSLWGTISASSPVTLTLVGKPGTVVTTTVGYFPANVAGGSANANSGNPNTAIGDNEFLAGAETAAEARVPDDRSWWDRWGTTVLRTVGAFALLAFLAVTLRARGRRVQPIPIENRSDLPVRHDREQ